MKKNNKKGFAIAEILAVTVVIMVIFVTVYSNFFPTTAEFERRVAYNDLESLYATYYMRQFYNDKFSNSTFLYETVYKKNGSCTNSNNNSKCSKIAASLEIEEMIVTGNNITNLKEKVKNNEESVKNISDDLKKYIKYLSTHFTQTTTNEQYRIILKTKSGYATSLLNYEKPIEPNKPTLTRHLLPVKYEADGTIKVTSENDSQWYDYDEAKWANAVTIKETARERYFDSDGNVIANDGTKVEEADINTMWVWIPRYNYTVFNYNADGNTYKPIKQIEIHFENTTTPEGTIYCNDDTSNGTSEVCYYKDKTIEKPIEIEGNTYSYGGTASTVNGATYTHPAFCFGNRTIDKDTGDVTCSGTELKGIWVGKFENSTDNSQKNNASTLTGTGAITILPDSETYIGFIIYEAYQAIREMELNNNPYGFYQKESNNVEYSKVHEGSDGYAGTDQLNNDTNSLDTHMMKNSEWGAVTYLALSKYGIYNTKNGGFNVKTDLQATVEIKNYSNACNDVCKTGSISDKSQSTTGNYYGIYDMSGGVPELVMGSTTGSKFGLIYDGGSVIWLNVKYGAGTYDGYLSDDRYYDKYVYNYKNDDKPETIFNNLKVKLGKLGDATKEVSWKIEKENKLEGWLNNINTKEVPYGGGNTTVVFSRGLDSIVYFGASDGKGTGDLKIGSRSVLVIDPDGGKL